MEIYRIYNHNGLVIVEHDAAIVIDGAESLGALRTRIDKYLADQEPDGEINMADPRLAREWISSKDVWRDHPEIARSTLGKACRDAAIVGAELRGREWWFPRSSFEAWRRRETKPGRKPGSKQTKEQVWSRALGMTKKDILAAKSKA